jgi:hypothetical protein
MDGNCMIVNNYCAAHGFTSLWLDSRNTSMYFALQVNADPFQTDLSSIYAGMTTFLAKWLL